MNYLKLSKNKKLLSSSILIVCLALTSILVFSSCGLNSDSSPCGGKIYNSPSMSIHGNYVFLSFYSRNKNQNPDASECTASTDPFDLKLGISIDNAQTWTSKTIKEKISVDSSAYKMYNQTLAVDPSSMYNIYVSYIDANGILYCASSRDQGNTWTYNRIDSNAGLTVNAHALGITSFGTLYVVYNAVDNTGSKLKYARSTDYGVSWNEIDNVDISTNAGHSPSIFIDLDNNVHVSYYQANVNGGLKYARLQAGTTSWSLKDVTSGDVSGPFSSINVSSGSIYISYYDPIGYTGSGTNYKENPDGLIKIFRSDNDGLTWLGPYTVDTLDYTGKASSITSANINGLDYVYLSYGLYHLNDTDGSTVENKLKFAYSTNKGVDFTIRQLEIDSNVAPTTGTSSLKYLNSNLQFYRSGTSNKLYLVYVGNSASNIIFQTSSDGGESWNDKHVLSL
jgi:hypothetical protein